MAAIKGGSPTAAELRQLKRELEEVISRFSAQCDFMIEHVSPRDAQILLHLLADVENRSGRGHLAVETWIRQEARHDRDVAATFSVLCQFGILLSCVAQVRFEQEIEERAKKAEKG